jgi:hypothetical protein
MKKILTKDDKGILWVTTVTPEWVGKFNGSEDEAIEHVVNKNFLDQDHFIVEQSALPPNKKWRWAWDVDDNGNFFINLERAREKQRQKIRLARVPTLGKLDELYMRADEVGATAEKQRIAEIKQRLRDLPADPRIDSALSTSDLDAVWDDELPSWEEYRKGTQ